MGMFDSFRQTINSGMAPIRQASNQVSNAVSRGLGPTNPIMQLAKTAQSNGAYNMGLMGNQAMSAMKYQVPGMIRDAASSARSGIQDMASNARRNMPSMNRFW